MAEELDELEEKTVSATDQAERGKGGTESNADSETRYPSFIKQLILPNTHVQLKNGFATLEGLAAQRLSTEAKQEYIEESTSFLKQLASKVPWLHLWQLASIGFGIYLSVLLAPLIFNSTF